MATVCLVGETDVDLRRRLLTHETARAALATYDLTEPFANAVAVETVSLGAAVSLLNDLNWYLVRYVAEALVRVPSVSETEWLSRQLATAVRNERIDPAESGRLLKVYGLEDGQLVEPMFVARTDGDIPTYDLRDVEETVVIRVTEAEFAE